MGVRFNPVQEAARKAVKADAGVQGLVQAIVSHLGAGHFLSGAAAVTAQDAVLLAMHYDLFSLIFTPSVASTPEELKLAQWYTAVTEDARVAAVLSERKVQTGGKVRIGGQVDLRPQHQRVSALADASIALNASHKKAESQRDVSEGGQAGKGRGRGRV